MAATVVFNVYFADARESDEPTLFERREDAEAYAALWESGNVEELIVMGERAAAIPDLEAQLALEQQGEVS